MKDERELDRERVTREVGSEGGSPGDIQIDRDADVATGSEAGRSVVPDDPGVLERDRQLTRDDRTPPEP